MKAFFSAALLAVTASAATMPVSDQNAIIAKYCAICHTDAAKNGGLSLQHFDAAQPDPGLMAMIVSKLNAGALGAAGLKLPDKKIQDDLQRAIETASTGSDKWYVNRSPDPAAKAPVLTAGIVRQSPSTEKTKKQNDGNPDLYWLTLTCHADTHQGEMQLAWSPGVPDNGRIMSAAADSAAPVSYKIEGTEKMGNGQGSPTGHGAVILNSRVPEKTLTIDNLFEGETIVFPFSDLAASERQQLSTCFK